MTITLTLSCDNAAFEGSDLGPEVERILTEAARRLRLRDVNGNTVGHVEVKAGE